MCQQHHEQDSARIHGHPYAALQAIDQAPEGVQQRAVYLCNAAACYLKKEMWQAAVEQCAAALSINDTYLKVGPTYGRCKLH